MTPTTKRQCPEAFLGPLQEDGMERSKGSKTCPWNPVTIMEKDIWRAASGLAVHVSKTSAIWIERCLCCEVKSDFCTWTGYYKQEDSKIHCRCVVSQQCYNPSALFPYKQWLTCGYIRQHFSYSFHEAHCGKGVQGYIVLGLCLCHESLQTKPCAKTWFLCVLLRAGSHKRISLGGARWSATDQTQGISYILWGAGTSGDSCQSSVPGFLLFSSVNTPYKLSPACNYLCKSHLAQRRSETIFQTAQ